MVAPKLIEEAQAIVDNEHVILMCDSIPCALQRRKLKCDMWSSSLMRRRPHVAPPATEMSLN